MCVRACVRASERACMCALCVCLRGAVYPRSTNTSPVSLSAISRSSKMQQLPSIDLPLLCPRAAPYSTPRPSSPPTPKPCSLARSALGVSSIRAGASSSETIEAFAGPSESEAFKTSVMDTLWSVWRVRVRWRWRVHEGEASMFSTIEVLWVPRV